MYPLRSEYLWCVLFVRSTVQDIHCYQWMSTGWQFVNNDIYRWQIDWILKWCKNQLNITYIFIHFFILNHFVRTLISDKIINFRQKSNCISNNLFLLSSIAQLLSRDLSVFLSFVWRQCFFFYFWVPNDVCMHSKVKMVKSLRQWPVRG